MIPQQHAGPVKCSAGAMPAERVAARRSGNGRLFVCCASGIRLVGPGCVARDTIFLAHFDIRAWLEWAAGTMHKQTGDRLRRSSAELLHRAQLRGNAVTCGTHWLSARFDPTRVLFQRTPVSSKCTQWLAMSTRMSIMANRQHLSRPFMHGDCHTQIRYINTNKADHLQTSASDLLDMAVSTSTQKNVVLAGKPQHMPRDTAQALRHVTQKLDRFAPVWQRLQCWRCCTGLAER
jgi:hypothetical protein